MANRRGPSLTRMAGVGMVLSGLVLSGDVGAEPFSQPPPVTAGILESDKTMDSLEHVDVSNPVATAAMQTKIAMMFCVPITSVFPIMPGDFIGRVGKADVDLGLPSNETVSFFFRIENEEMLFSYDFDALNGETVDLSQTVDVSDLKKQIGGDCLSV
jgi:hypothetical protein